MSPDVRKIHSPLAYRLRLIHRAALLGKIVDKNFMKAQVQYKKD